MRSISSDLAAKGISSIHETQAIELLNDYQERILRGDWPDIDDYMSQYRGPEPGNFRTELQLATVLLIAGGQCRQAESNGTEDGRRDHDITGSTGYIKGKLENE